MVTLCARAAVYISLIRCSNATVNALVADMFEQEVGGKEGSDEISVRYRVQIESEEGAVDL